VKTQWNPNQNKIESSISINQILKAENGQKNYSIKKSN
jgi:hypothetical protein